jgi:hypothetical protein
MLRLGLWFLTAWKLWALPFRQHERSMKDILTEGVTDRRVLEASLKLLYPHLAEYYAFMDFDGANAPGGAGQLVNTVKAFAGAGIANRVIALFDNDTAARSALRGLEGVSLPSSMRVLQISCN